jgi:hypothetical protein
MKKLLVVLGGLVFAAGCSPAMVHTGPAPSGPSAPAVKPAVPQATQQTVNVDYRISSECRAELTGLKNGRDILVRYDAQFGYWTERGNPPAEVANTADQFRDEASRAGATSC